MLQHLLEQKWKLGPDDKDLVVMWHRFRYTWRRCSEIHASLVVIGQDQLHTAMARTVGLPIAMACKLVLNGKIADRGVLLPLKPAIYDPILDELEKHGVVFEEAQRLISAPSVGDLRQKRGFFTRVTTRIPEGEQVQSGSC